MLPRSIFKASQNLSIPIAQINQLNQHLITQQQSRKKSLLEDITSCWCQCKIQDPLFSSLLLLSTCLLFYEVNNRLDSVSTPADRLTDKARDVNAGELVRALHSGYVQEEGDLKQCLKVLRLFPFFFCPVPVETKFQKVEARPVLHELQAITNAVCTPYAEGLDVMGGFSHQRAWAHRRLAPPRLVMFKAHLDSMSNKKTQASKIETIKEDLIAPWSGLTVTADLYFSIVFGVWHQAYRFETLSLTQLLFILNQDLEETTEDMTEGNHEAQAYWLWKAFVGAYSIAQAKAMANESMPRDLVAAFVSHLRRWSRKSGITAWAQGRHVLMTIAWPAQVEIESFARALWYSSIISGRCL